MTPLAIGSSESPSDRNSSFKIEFKISFELIGSSFKLQKILETSVHKSWKLLLTEAKTQYGIQKRNVRVCRIMKIAVNKAKCLLKNSR